MKQTPLLLIGFRLSLAPIIIIAAFSDHYLIIIICFLLAILSDIFDGIIARHLSVSTAFLRRADTWVDRIFWLSALACIGISCPYFLEENSNKLIVVAGFELCSHAISFFRFKRGTSSHNLLSKLWGITIVPAFSQMLIFCHSAYMFDVFIFTGIAARFDAILIMCILPQWDFDIPSAWHAWQIKKGKPVKRRRLLNS